MSSPLAMAVDEHFEAEEGEGVLRWLDGTASLA